MNTDKRVTTAAATLLPTKNNEIQTTNLSMFYMSRRFIMVWKIFQFEKSSKLVEIQHLAKNHQKLPNLAQNCIKIVGHTIV